MLGSVRLMAGNAATSSMEIGPGGGGMFCAGADADIIAKLNSKAFLIQKRAGSGRIHAIASILLAEIRCSGRRTALVTGVGQPPGITGLAQPRRVLAKIGSGYPM